MDPYSILGVERGASDEDVQKAYKKLAMQFHPDRNPNDKSAENRFKEINAARDAIKNAQQNQQPDHGFTWNFHNGFNMEDIFAAMHAHQHRRNRDINVECQISLEQAFYGTDLTVNIQNDIDVRTVSVKIPAGIENGMRIRVPQAGENSFPAMSPGDLFVIVHVRQHDKFQRRGKDLHIQIEINLFDVLLGGTTNVVGIDGSILELNVPKNFSPDTQLRLTGQGMPMNSVRGDLLVSIRVGYPILNDEQREMIKKAKLLTEKFG